MVKRALQAVSATQEWRNRMLEARERIREVKPPVGQQDVILWVVREYPHLNLLTYASRWRNAWLGRNADPEMTLAVEAAATHFEEA